MIKRIIAGVLFFCLLSLTSCGETSYFENTEAENQTELSELEEAEESAETNTTWFVQVTGQVNSPGVYELPENARVYEAIEAAGGLTEDADDSNLNQAAFLTDGEKLIVYSKEQAEELASQSDEGEDGLVNINTASAEELMTLPGIGESKANAIIAYREKNGAYSSIEDIKNISGIKDGVYSKIADLIKAE